MTDNKLEIYDLAIQMLASFLKDPNMRVLPTSSTARLAIKLLDREGFVESKTSKTGWSDREETWFTFKKSKTAAAYHLLYQNDVKLL